ncbi:MAG: rRNA pseudouridine synthase [Deltaproteobacteria bacterium]|nr:rRNA pseudouridine synthase [Deltaproteobacteria bacterium]
MKVRIQKIIATSGITSRRKAEELIKEGRVTINGRKVAKPGTLADPGKDKIRVDGKLITGNNKKLYILLNKPRGYITSFDDPQNRPKVIDLLKKIKTRVFPVGRLDYIAEGLLLMTNDGSLAHRLLHPRFAVPRTYLVKVKGFPDFKTIKNLRTGIQLSDGMTFPGVVKFMEKTKKNSWVRITVKEGRNKLLKRMFAEVGHPVLKLTRIKFGPFSLGKLSPGEYRIISPEEVKKLV